MAIPGEQHLPDGAGRASSSAGKSRRTGARNITRVLLTGTIYPG